jgi:LacI family transcriptional regulator
VGSLDRAWAARREKAFHEYLTARGFQPHIYRQPAPRDRDWERGRNIWRTGSASCRRRLACLPATTIRGAVQACGIAELHVRRTWRSSASATTKCFAELSDPPLSSVSLNAEAAGYRAAALLDSMMRGRVRTRQRILVEALTVVTRRSTEVVAVEDQDIAAALQFIHREQGRGISVESVVHEVAVSRRNLEKRFREIIGRTILEEIQLVRLERAKRLLVETTYPISKVASLSGFGSTGYFIQFFQNRVGKTPRKYRMDLVP